MTKREYQKLLQAPKWKAKREIILKRDGNACVKCGREKRLQVHHLYYMGENAPWDYPDTALVTLCARCHKEEHQKYSKVQENFFFTFIDFVSGFFQLKSRVSKDVIVKFCMISEFNSNKVYLPTNRRKAVCEELNITSQQLSNAIHELKKLGLLTGEKGTYQINPIVHWKGSLQARQDLIN